ncbi:MAG: AAA family ATPase [Candidatus Parabeggiatoa sp.]|nr:AAA family ATPase [Candidatus Parabeggiatoa sp.]
MRIEGLSIENFTLFGKNHLKFSDGLNIIIGENDTGKSHLLRLLYALIESNNLVALNKAERKNYLLQLFIPQKLIDIFKPEELAHLIKSGQKKSQVKIDFTEYSIKFNFTLKTKIQVNIDKNEVPATLIKQDSLFIPTKEILSFYDGFMSLYLTRQLPVDETYYNLAQALGLLVLKDISFSSKEQQILTHLETLLNGKLLLEKGRVYLSKKGKKREISLVAEGLRKIGTLSHLIANGSLNQNSILFWDEPESNLNPKLMRELAKVLVDLSSIGVQIFLNTHSLFLIKEFEILREMNTKIKYFSLGFNVENNLRVSQSEDIEGLDDLVILDENLAQSDRFMKKVTQADANH